MNHPKNTSRKTTVRMQAPLGERQIVTELSEDIELPDYQPEIKRLLRVEANVSPAEVYIGAGNVECTGTVDYSILYSGADGMLWCATPSGAYRYTFPVELPADFDAGEGLICDTASQPENVSGRVTAPRRLTLRCRLRTRAQLWGTRVMPDPTEQLPGIQRLTEARDCARLFLGAGEPFTVGDEILCDPRDGDVRVISAGGQVFVTEAAAGSGTVDCRGEVCLRLLCCHDGTGEVYPVLRRVPFAQTVEMEGVEVNCEATATGHLGDLRVTVGDGRIVCDAAVSLAVRATRNETVSLLRDAYATGSECEAVTRTLRIPVALRTVLGNFTVGHTAALEDAGMRPGMQVIDADGTVTMGETECARGKYVLTGKCRFRLITVADGDWSVQEIEVPVRYSVEGAGHEDCPVAATEADACVISCRARADGEKLVLDAEIAVSGTLRGEEPAPVLSELTPGAAWQMPGAVYTVCYPAKDDTLWRVAKRYHVPVSELIAKNALAQAPAADAPDSLAGVRYLLV